MVCGVSDSPDNLGRNTVENLERFGFPGSVYLAGREGGEFNGRKIYQQIEDIEAVPELAVLLVPAKTVPDARSSSAEGRASPAPLFNLPDFRNSQKTFGVLKKI